ncbi:MAG: TVP38/TMEM64 family protein [Deltaproteobacteria bacterium]|nr:TVP38/TMEM64 family protein [Deltaproteobacteria bacterium]
MTKNFTSTNKHIYRIPIAVVVVCFFIFLGYVYHQYLWEKITYYYHLFADREQVKTLVASFGQGAPAIFIFIQILQVLFAPFPGETTGFIGGFLFGTAKGFIYSSIGLTIGSWINFTLGRFMGKRFIRKLIPERQLNRLDKIVQRQGVIVLFILFVIPDFPKDYLCLFLGLSSLPLKIFLIITGIGRMPGTLMLSLQGSYIFEQKYGLFAVIMGLCLMVIFLAYKYQKPLYQWLEKYNEK